MKKNNTVSPQEKLKELTKECIVIKDINVNGKVKDSFDYQIIKSAHEGIGESIKELPSSDEFIKSLLKSIDKSFVCVIAGRAINEDIIETAYISYRLLEYLMRLDKKDISETDSILLSQMFKDEIKDNHSTIRLNESGIIKAPNERLRSRFREHNARMLYQIQAKKSYIDMVEGR